VWPSVWHLVLLALLAFRKRLDSWRQKHPSYRAIYSGIVAGLSAYIIYQIVTRVDGTMLALIIGASVSIAVYSLSRIRVPETIRWLVILIGFGVGGIALTVLNIISPTQFTNDSPWYVHSLRGAPDFVTFLLGGFAGLGLWLLFRCTPDDAEARRGRRFPLKHNLRLAGSFQRFDLFTWLCISLLGVMAVQTPGLLRLSLRSGHATDIPPLVQAAQWAQANTTPDALFYDTAGDGSEFRLWSLRSVTHGWKELGLVGYSQPLDLAPMLERYQRIVAHSENPDEVLAMASELGADYIIRNRAFPLDLPVSYSNREIVIYQFVP